MSDGSSTLTERDPQTFAPTATWSVAGYEHLNELDYDGHSIWANQWPTNQILRVDAQCHQVDGIVDAANLTTRAKALSAGKGGQIDVLNGIASIPGTDRFFVTGKLWPVMFEVRFS